MTNFPINSTVIFSAQKGRVLAVEAGKRGRVLLTVHLQDGRTVKLDSRSVEVLDEVTFDGVQDWSAPTLTSEQALRASYNRTSSK